jgi:sugar lactone lactonase YvrE
MAAAVVAIAATATAVTGGVVAATWDGTAPAVTISHTWKVPCPAAAVVTPTLNANLVANPDDRDAVRGRPDCWTSTVSTTSTPGGAGASTDTATQTIDVSSLKPGGQPFRLSHASGALTVTFENGGGASLGQASVSTGSAPAWYGTVPAGTARVLLTLSTAGTKSTSGAPGLVIGPAAAPKSPVLQTLPYAKSAHGTPGTHVNQVTGQTVPNILPGYLYSPAGVSAANGTVYVSNTGDNVIAALRNGETSVIAGSTTNRSAKHPADTGADADARSATLNQPAGTAVDARGDIFVADSGGNVIREITPDGTIRRFAGTGTAGSKLSGTSALGSQLNHPEAVAVDAKGDVFIADTRNNRVLMVSPAGKILTVVGNGHGGYAGDNGEAPAAELNQPAGVAADADGNLYIADTGNDVVRRVDAMTGVITTVAGNYASAKENSGIGGFFGSGIPATQVQLNHPEGLAIDGAGDLFVADTFNHAVREVSSSGIVSTVVNSQGAPGPESSGSDPAASQLDDPSAVAVDASTGTLYIADTRNSQIAEVLRAARGGDAPGPAS